MQFSFNLDYGKNKWTWILSLPHNLKRIICVLKIFSSVQLYLQRQTGSLSESTGKNIKYHCYNDLLKKLTHNCTKIQTCSINVIILPLIHKCTIEYFWYKWKTAITSKTFTSHHIWNKYSQKFSSSDTRTLPLWFIGFDSEYRLELRGETRVFNIPILMWSSI